MIGTNNIVMNKASIIEQYDMLGGAVVAGSNVEYTTQQGCFKAGDAINITNTKYTSNAADATLKNGGNGFLQVTATASGQVDATAEVVRADGAITQSINGSKTFDSSVTVGDASGSNTFVSAGGYVQLSTPSGGADTSIKFKKGTNTHTLTMNDLGTSLSNLSFDANINVTSGNHFKVNQHQIQVSDLFDGAKVHEEDTDALKLTNPAYTASAVDASGKTGAHGLLQVIEQTSGLIANTAEVVRADGSITQTVDGLRVV